MQAQAADLDDRVVLDDVVVGREHGGVLGGHADLVAGVAHGGHGLDVVPVAVGLEHPAHVEPLAQLEQLLVLVGGVEQHGVAGRACSAGRTRCCRTGPTTSLWISAWSSL